MKKDIKENENKNEEIETIENTETVDEQEHTEPSLEEQFKELQAQVQQLLQTKTQAQDEPAQEADPVDEEQVTDNPATDREADFTAREKALFDRQVALELKAEGLEDFAPLIHATNEAELAEQINKLKELVNKRKLNNSYKPTDHNTASNYSQAVKNRDVLSMLKTKINY
ncbi:hypothetical protein [Enterococcus sp. JM9B]|uniref:hypothetical protein n=1 Tax=Enterococcus sp. JM9B TaxID=1857216 RepID=UPI001374AE67|nr:hypothetical protein [Enterococcus sp. JM9B]KAF1304845.1 hypothetical protein BAU16_01350 [Enterococcus sp. JM9B]